MLTRRNLLRSLLAAPIVITTPGLLMPVRSWRPSSRHRWFLRDADGAALRLIAHPVTLLPGWYDVMVDGVSIGGTETVEIDIKPSAVRLFSRATAAPAPSGAMASGAWPRWAKMRA